MCTVTVIIGQVGDGFSPIADYCEGTVFIVSQGDLEARSVAALKKRGLDVNHLNVNFKKLGILHKKISIMRDDIQKDYGGISILINSATYICGNESKISMHGQAKTVIYLNCLAVLTISHILLPILRNSATIVYCTLRHNVEHSLPENITRRLKYFNTNYNTIKMIMSQYLRSIKSGNHDWGASSYAVAKAGFTAMKKSHEKILAIRGIKSIFDIDVDISLDPYNLYSGNTSNCSNISFCVQKVGDKTNYEIDTQQANDVQNVNNGVLCISEADATAVQPNVRKRSRQDSTNDQESPKKLCSHNIISNNQNGCQAHLNVAICKNFKEITEDEANYIKEEIDKAIISACTQPTDAHTIYPAFRSSPCFNEGVLKLWCADDHTLSWLRSTVSLIKLSNNDRELIVIDQQDLPGKLKAALYIPNFKDEIRLLQKILTAQNRWCDMRLWSLCSVQRTTTEEPCGILLILSIPEADVPKIMMRERQISFMAGSVSIRFVTNAAFTNDPAEAGGAGDSLVLVPVNDCKASFPTLRDVFCCIDEFVPKTYANAVWDEIV